MKKTDFANMSSQELLEKETEIKKQLFKLNYERHSGRVEKPHQFSFLRKDVARIKTVLAKKDKIREKA